MQPDEHFGHWFAGFADGEGSFVITRRGANGTGYGCSFIIIVRADDRPILEEIRDRFQIGLIHAIKPSRVTSGHHSRAGAGLYITRKEDVLRLVAVFDRYPLRAKKRNDYQIWRDAVMLWTSRVGVRGPGKRSTPHPVQARLAELKEELTAQRRLSYKGRE